MQISQKQEFNQNSSQNLQTQRYLVQQKKFIFNDQNMTIKTTTTRIKVMSETQQQYETQKKYLHLDYKIKSNVYNKQKPRQTICLDEGFQQIQQKDSQHPNLNSEMSEDVIEKLKIKLGFIKKINQMKGQQKNKNQGREFIQAPEHKIIPTCLVPEFGRYQWPPKMSQHRVWRRQMKESRRLT